jgi:PTS system N-acetylgalactosamine-specific IID component
MKSNECERLITKKDLNRMAWRAFFLQASFSFERMQAGGWEYILMPALKKIYKNEPEKLKAALKDHLEFFNINPFVVTPVAGIITAMEEKGEDRETIRGVKYALMGPLAGIGDALIWLTIFPICAGLGASLAMQGNFLGPILFLILFNALHFFLQFAGIGYGYNTGINALGKLRTGTKEISKLASIIGLTVIGGLIASYVSISTPLVLHAGKVSVKLQADILDKVMPNLLPLAFTFFIYWLLKKGLTPTKLFAIILVFGIVTKYFGIL